MGREEREAGPKETCGSNGYAHNLYFVEGFTCVYICHNSSNCIL